MKKNILKKLIHLHFSKFTDMLTQQCFFFLCKLKCVFDLCTLNRVRLGLTLDLTSIKFDFNFHMLP